MSWFRRKRRAIASHRQGAVAPSRLSLRRKRRKPRKPQQRSVDAISFSRREKPLREKPPTRLSFRSRRHNRARAPAAEITRRLSFRRRRYQRGAAPAAEMLRRLSFRRTRAAAVTQSWPHIAKLAFWRRPEAEPRAPREGASDPWRLTARLIAVGFAACMLQMLVISQIGVLGVTADVAPLVVAATGFLCGPLTGACFGFAVGLFTDLAFVQVLGISSLLFTLIGYGAGRLRESRAREAPATRLALGAVATAVALAGYGAIEFMLGVNAPIGAGLVGAIVKTTLLNSLIALPVYALTRRSLLSALPASERELNRPATTTRISPLTRA